jgi:hypothetical protein
MAIGRYQHLAMSKKEHSAVKFCKAVDLMVLRRYVAAAKNEKGAACAALFDGVLKDVVDLHMRQVTLAATALSVKRHFDPVQGVFLLRVYLE